MLKKLLKLSMTGLLLASSFVSNAQTTVTLTTGQDAMVRVQNPTTSNTPAWNTLNYSSTASNYIYSWTHGGVPTNASSYLNFDFTSIPAGATITSATLNLKCATNDVSFSSHNWQAPGGDNSFFVNRVTTPWAANTVTFDTRPTSTATNRVAVAQTGVASTLNYGLNVTAMVQDMFTSNSLNGFELVLQNTAFTAYRNVSFGSFENANTALRPTLSVTYTACTNALVPTMVSPDASGSTAQFYVGGKSVYKFSFANNSNLPITGFDIAPSSLPFGFSNVVKKVNGIVTNTTFTIPAHTTVNVEISGVYTALSMPGTFTQGFTYLGTGCSGPINGTLTKQFVKTIIGCPGALSSSTIDCSAALPVLAQTSLSIHNTWVDMKAMDFKFNFENNILNLASPAYTLNSLLAASTVTTTTTVSGTTTTVNYHVEFPSLTDFVSNSSLSNGGPMLLAGTPIITLRFNMIAYPSCLAKVNSDDFYFTNASNVAQPSIATDYSTIAVTGAACGCTNATLDASFTAATSPFRVGTPFTLTATTATGIHTWKVGGSNGQLLGYSGQTALYTPSVSGLLVIEHTIISGNAAKTSTQTLNVLNAIVTTPSPLKFDGTDDYVEANDYPAINFGTGNFTMEAWIKADLVQVSYPQIMSKRSNTSDGFMFGLWSDGKPFIQMAGIGNWVCTSCPNLKDNVCHQVAITRTGGTMSYYVDGTLRFTQPVDNTIRSTNSPSKLMIGRDRVSSSNTAFKGTIEEVRLWNVARTATEISAKFNKRLFGTEPNLVANFRIDETSGQKIFNIAYGQPYDGTIGSTVNVDANDPIWFSTSCVPINSASRNDEANDLNNQSLDNVSLEALSVKPNPSTDGNFSLSINIPTEEISEINMFDGQGTNLGTSINKDQLEQTINLGNQVNGIYYLVVKLNSGKVHTQKLSLNK